MSNLIEGYSKKIRGRKKVVGIDVFLQSREKKLFLFSSKVPSQQSSMLRIEGRGIWPCLLAEKHKDDFKIRLFSYYDYPD